MNKIDKIKMLENLTEQELTERILIPLYESEGMGAKSVRFTHGTLEYGKDIIYYRDDEYGNRIYAGVQVKRTKITTVDVKEIVHQIRKAFGKPFTDVDGKVQKIDRFVVLTSNKFGVEAQEALWADLRPNNLDKIVTFIDQDQLLKLLDSHLPSAFWEEYDHFNKFFNEMKKDFEIIRDISAIGKGPIPIEDIYVSLKVRDRSERHELVSDLTEGKDEDESKKRIEEISEENDSIIDPESALQFHKKILIMGNPGSGKTTLLKHLALKICKKNLENIERKCIPILVILREFSKSTKNLREYIDNVFDKYMFSEAKKFIEESLQRGKCLLLLDGFDELITNEKKNKIANEVYAFIKQYPNCQFIITSRVAGYHDELIGFKRLEIMEFDDEQIWKFIENWFTKEESEKVHSIFDAIIGNEKLKALSRTPLMLAIISFLFEVRKELPKRRADLYELYVNLLLDRWDYQKNIQNKYDSSQKKLFLRKLAFYAYNHNKRRLSEEDINQHVRSYFPKMGLKEQDAKTFLDEIWERSYLLRRISEKEYDFLHLSFQEYFTALEIKEQSDGMNIIIQHLDDPWWNEPIFLYVGVRKDATDLINKINDSRTEDIFYSNLFFTGKCIAEAEFIDPSLKDKIVQDLLSLYLTSEFLLLRKNSINIISLIKPVEIIDSLIKDLTDRNSSNKLEIVQTLGNIRSEKAIEPLVEIIVSPENSSDIKERATLALINIGGRKAVDALVKILTAETLEFVRERVANALGRIGSEKEVDSLIKIVTSTENDIDIRSAAAISLGRIKSKKAAIPLIHILDKSRNKVFEEYPIHEDKKMREEGGIRVVTKVEKEINLRARIVEALGRIEYEHIEQNLIEILTSKYEYYSVREEAAIALARIKSKKAVDPLVEILSDSNEDSFTRISSAEALGLIGGEKAFDALVNFLVNEAGNMMVRETAAYALRMAGKEKAIDPLMKIVKNPNEGSYLRGLSAYTLGIIGEEKVSKSLIKIAKQPDEDRYARAGIIDALGLIRYEKAVLPLIEILTNRDECSLVRARSAYALGMIGNKEAITPLRNSLDDLSFESHNKDTIFESLEKICRKNSERIIKE